jgi:hypothetical protein
MHMLASIYSRARVERSPKNLTVGLLTYGCVVITLADAIPRLECISRESRYQYL